ncbi:MAG: hypothetical protein R3D45_04895 [Rhizobiaceae bacterium]
MKTILIALALLVPAVAQANSRIEHDRRLEQAAADIVAARIGEIRGSFRLNERPEFVAGGDRDSGALPAEPDRPNEGGAVWKDGLAPARGIPEYRRGNI